MQLEEQTEDAEVATMMQVHGMLSAFSSAAQGRMLRYIAERLSECGTFQNHGLSSGLAAREAQAKMRAAQCEAERQRGVNVSGDPYAA